MVWREERTCDGKARHTQELTLEQPTERALSAAAKLVGKTWYPDEPAKWDGLCEKIELAHHLEHATYVRAAMLGDRFAGIVAAGPAQSEAGTARADAGALWYRNHMRAYAPWVLGTPDEPRIGLALVPITAEIALTQELVERGDARSAWATALDVRSFRAPLTTCALRARRASSSPRMTAAILASTTIWGSSA